MNIAASVKKGDANYQAVLEAVHFLKKHEVLIGIPEEIATRKDEKSTPVNNAELLFIHTNGSPALGIPPRPVLEPAIKNSRERIAESLKKAVDAAVDGKRSEIMPALEAAGLEGQNIVRDFFTDPNNAWPPNTPETIQRKTKGRGGQTNPLIDTGEMRKSITYVVRAV